MPFTPSARARKAEAQVDFSLSLFLTSNEVLLLETRYLSLAIAAAN